MSFILNFAVQSTSILTEVWSTGRGAVDGHLGEWSSHSRRPGCQRWAIDRTIIIIKFWCFSLIGWRENLKEPPIFHGKNRSFRFRFSLHSIFHLTLPRDFRAHLFTEAGGLQMMVRGNSSPRSLNFWLDRWVNTSNFARSMLWLQLEALVKRTKWGGSKQQEQAWCHSFWPNPTADS